MTVQEARELLGPEFDDLSDQTLEKFIQLCELLCIYVISLERGKNKQKVKSKESETLNKKS